MRQVLVASAKGDKRKEIMEARHFSDPEYDFAVGAMPSLFSDDVFK